MPYADPEMRKACRKRYRSKPHVKAHFNEYEKRRAAARYAADPEKERARRAPYRQKEYIKSRARIILNEARKRAKKKGLPFNLTDEDIAVPEKCPVFGITLEPGRGVRTNASPSIDRIIPELGYVKGNVRVISWRANRLKLDAKISELKKVIEYMEKEERLMRMPLFSQ